MKKAPEILEYQSRELKGETRFGLRRGGVGPVVWGLMGLLLAAIVLAMIVPTTGCDPGATRTTTDLRFLAVALESYRMDTGTYPSTAEGLAALVKCPPGTTGWSGPYLEEVVDDKWGTPYRYQFPGRTDPAKFDLHSVGPDKVDGTADDVVYEP